MSNATILREYLIALGFEVKPDSEKKADAALQRISKRTFYLGSAITGTVVAAKLMVDSFARGMEQMYYDSRRANSTVSNLQALGSGAERVGLSADKVKGSVIAMNMAMRQNPGLKGLLESFGVKVEGRDMSDVWKDMVDQFRRMPFYIGSQFAEMFGLDPDTFLLASEGLDKLREAEKKRADLSKEMGVDADAAAKASVEYLNTLRDISDRWDVMKQAAAIGLLPTFREVSGVIKEVLKDWTHILGNMQKEGGVTGLFGKFMEGLKDYVNPGAAKRGGVVLGWGVRKDIEVNGLTGKSPPKLSGAASAQDSQQPQFLFDSLERKYGLPSGVLDRMWKKESNRGDPRFMLSRAGAQGHFQFMPGTAKEYGVDPYDLASSADGAARFLQKYLGLYGGNMEMALAAYNWGPGNVAKKGLGAAPAETRDYMGMANGLSYNPQTTIIVSASDPMGVAREIERAQDRSNATAVRHLQAVVQ